MTGEANDAVSAHSKSPIEGISQIAEASVDGMPSIVVQVNGTRSMTQWFPWKNLVRPTVGRIIVGGQIGRITITSKYGERKSWECSCFHRKDKLFLSVYVDDVRKVRGTESLAPMRQDCETRSNLKVQLHSQIKFFWDALKEHPHSTKKRPGQQHERFRKLQRQMWKKLPQRKPVTILNRFRHGVMT